MGGSHTRQRGMLLMVEENCPLGYGGINYRCLLAHECCNTISEVKTHMS
jgi:hypothetical protein